jgi:hypothetical protein
MIVVQFSYNFCTILTTFFYDQPLDLFSYNWALSIQLLILKKVVRVVRKLYENCARNITLKEKDTNMIKSQPFNLKIMVSRRSWCALLQLKERHTERVTRVVMEFTLSKLKLNDYAYKWHHWGWWHAYHNIPINNEHKGLFDDVWL